MPLPSITVITPTFNSAATLPETLGSVRSQSYAGALEHIVVDGGSTDDTLAQVRAAGLRYVSEPDRGLTHALNKGLAMARHEILGSLNSDDTYLPGALTAVGQAFAATPGAEWVTGPCVIVDARGRETRTGISRYKNCLLAHHSHALHLVHNYISAPSTFVRHSALDAVGGYDERFHYSADYDMWLRLGRRGDPVVLDQPLATFRMAGDSLSLTGFEAQFREHTRNAREHGHGYPVSVLANRAASRLIVMTYRARSRMTSRSASAS